MYMRKSESVGDYLQRKVSRYAQIRDMHDVVNIKAQAVEHFNKMPPVERLSEAEFDCEYLRTTDKIGNLYYSGVRIWINRDGRIWANRPSGKEYRYSY